MGNVPPTRVADPIPDSMLDEFAFMNLVIDRTLLEFSGSQSNTVLRSKYSQFLRSCPPRLEKFITLIRPAIPNPIAFGIGAFIICWGLESILNEAASSNSVASELEKVLANEKEMEIFNIVQNYLKNASSCLDNISELIRHTKSAEELLSLQLTRVKNSLLNNNMSTLSFKIWVNGAAFHVQMLIYLVRLQGGTRHRASTFIDIYLNELETLVVKFKEFKQKNIVTNISLIGYGTFSYNLCDTESHITRCYDTDVIDLNSRDPAGDHIKFGRKAEDVVQSLFGRDQQIPLLRDYFREARRNLDALPGIQ